MICAPTENPWRNCRTPLRPVRISVRVRLQDLGVDGRILKLILNAQN
jgi:hypothetical protein